MIRLNVSKLFRTTEPWDCSNSVANLGPRAAEYTWAKSLQLAARHEDWLLSPLQDALDYMCRWARETGAWTTQEIQSWSNEECLALLVQNVASDMRTLGADDASLADAVSKASLETSYGVYWVVGDGHPDAGEVQGELY